jgi:hypothetical protein
MGLILVTGVCGSGKSAVRLELRRRALAAVELDVVEKLIAERDRGTPRER